MTIVINTSTGTHLPCCWDDCWKDGHDEIKVVKRDGNKSLHYVFCSTGHRDMYVNGHRSYGNR